MTSETKNEVESIKLEGNPICVTVLEGKIIVALDGFCAAWSTRTPRHASDKVCQCVGGFIQQLKGIRSPDLWDIV